MDISELRRESEAYKKRQADELGRGRTTPRMTHAEVIEMHMGLALKSYESFLFFKAMAAVFPALKWNAMACAVLTKGCLLEAQTLAESHADLRKQLAALKPIDFEGDTFF